MRSIRSLRGAAACGIALTSLVALAARADLAAWDQGRATAIAQQLAAACDDFEQAVRKQPGIDELGEGSAGAGFSLTERARTLREQSRALAGHLEKGKGRDQTVNEWRGLREVSDDVEESAQRAQLLDPTMAAWAKVADLMRQLAPYYDPKAAAAP